MAADARPVLGGYRAAHRDPRLAPLGMFDRPARRATRRLAVPRRRPAARRPGGGGRSRSRCSPARRRQTSRAAGSCPACGTRTCTSRSGRSPGDGSTCPRPPPPRTPSCWSRHGWPRPPPAAGTALVGFGFRDGLSPDAPTSALLDEVVGDVPVVLVSGDLHCAWVSTAGLRFLGVGRPRPAAARGRVVAAAGGGRPRARRRRRRPRARRHGRGRRPRGGRRRGLRDRRQPRGLASPGRRPAAARPGACGCLGGLPGLSLVRILRNSGKAS